jgi:hypothetical protein
MWNAELESLSQDPAVVWSECQEERHFRAVREALALSRDAGREVAGLRVRNVAEGALRQRGKVPRRALSVDVSAVGQDYRALVPVTTLDNGHNFRYYFEDVEYALEGPVAGILLVHRRLEFERGGRTTERFKALSGNRLRVVALEEFPASLQRLECFLRFLDRAIGQELLIDGVSLAYTDCQDYLFKTTALDGLVLF